MLWEMKVRFLSVSFNTKMMRYIILLFVSLSGSSLLAQPSSINGMMSMDLSFYPMKFNDIGVMVNPTSPNTQGPDETSMLSFGGGINGGVIFPFELSDNINSGIRISAGVFGMQVTNIDDFSETGYSMGLTGRVVGYVSYLHDDIGYGLMIGSKYNTGIYKKLIAIIGAEVFFDDQYTITLYSGLNPLRWQYTLSNGEVSETLKMNEIGLSFIFYP